MRIELEKTERWPLWALWPAIWMAIWLALVAAVRLCQPDGAGGLVLCPLKRTAGLPCPTCGATRGVFSALGGDLLGAIAYNPMVFFGMLVVSIALLLRLGFSRTIRLHASARHRIGMWVAFAAVVLGNWAYVICMDR
jgi:hypothetical protein